MCFDIGKKGKKKNVKSFIFPLFVCKEKRKEKCMLYLCALINDMKIYILEEQSLVRLQPCLIK